MLSRLKNRTDFEAALPHWPAASHVSVLCFFFSAVIEAAPWDQKNWTNCEQPFKTIHVVVRAAGDNRPLTGNLRLLTAYQVFAPTPFYSVSEHFGCLPTAHKEAAAAINRYIKRWACGEHRSMMVHSRGPVCSMLGTCSQAGVRSQNQVC